MKSILKIRWALAVLVLFIMFQVQHGLAKDIVNTSSDCADILLVFARGSSSNKNHEYLDQPFGPDFHGKEPEAGGFFQTFKQALDVNYPHITYKAQSVHNFPDKYSPVGYRAVHAFVPAPRFVDENTLNSEWSIFPGEYRDSVEQGEVEVTGYVREEISRCPNQQIVMGGYSQGAEVIGNGLFDFTPEQRQHIAGVALFGDPKYIGAYKDSSGKFVEQPWKRGMAPNHKTGMLDPRKPYLPDDMKKKVFSWCFDDDFICTGTKTFAKNFGEMVSEGKSLGAGHTRYPSFGVPNAANEIVQDMAPTLYALNKNRGGVDKGAGPAQAVPYVPNTKPIDVMFLIDVSYDVDDVIARLRTQTDNVTAPMQGFFNGVRYGFAYYNELDQYGTLLPRYVIGQQPMPYQPVTSPIFSTTLTSNFVKNLAWGGKSGGGADVADPHGLMVEKASLGTYWDPAAIKHIVLITDRPIKESFTYNICHSDIVSAFNLHDPYCATAPGTVSELTYMHSELCDRVWLAISQTECSLNMSSPGYVHNITRTFDDAIRVAQTQRTDVSVVIPHGLHETVTNKPAAEKRLEYFAKATGGLYIKYDLFTRADYTDMLWQVLNHQPKEIALAYKDALDVLGADQALPISKQVRARTNVPVTFDVSASTAIADQYKWDFDGDGTWDQESDSPNIEHIFTTPSTNQFMQVAAYNGGEQQASTTLPLTVEQYNGAIPDNTPPELPENLKAKFTSSGDIEVTWDAGSAEVIVVIKDPETGMPLVGIAADQGRITIPKDFYTSDSLEILASNDRASSEPVIIDVEPLPEVIVEVEAFTGFSAKELLVLEPSLSDPAYILPEAANDDRGDEEQPQTTAPAVVLANTVAPAESDNQVLGAEITPTVPVSVAETIATKIPSVTRNSNHILIYLVIIGVGGTALVIFYLVARKNYL